MTTPQNAPLDNPQDAPLEAVSKTVLLKRFFKVRTKPLMLDHMKHSSDMSSDEEDKKLRKNRVTKVFSRKKDKNNVDQEQSTSMENPIRQGMPLTNAKSSIKASVSVYWKRLFHRQKSQRQDAGSVQETSADEGQETSADNEQETSTDNQKKMSAEKGQETSAEKGQETNAEKGQETSVEKRLETSAENEPDKVHELPLPVQNEPEFQLSQSLLITSQQSVLSSVPEPERLKPNPPKKRPARTVSGEQILNALLGGPRLVPSRHTPEVEEPNQAAPDAVTSHP